MSSPKHPPPTYRNAGSAPAATPSATPPTLRRVAAPASAVRLNKRLADMGLCSRREADDWIAKGWVQVNGRVATMGLQVAPSDRVTVDRQAQGQQANRVTILLNKPLGIVSGQAEDGHAPAISLIQPASRWRDDNARFFFHPSQLRGLAPAGRLDIDSTGLLVLTQDGRVARQLIGEDAGMEKEYLVRVAYTGAENPAAATSAAATHAPLRTTLRLPSGAASLGLIDEHDPVTRDVQSVFPRERLALLRHGLSLDGQPLKPARVEWQNPEQLRFVLTEGKKRQIRRMCELVGLKVVGLKRVRIGRVMLGKLPLGQWRYLAPHERF